TVAKYFGRQHSSVQHGVVKAQPRAASCSPQERHVEFDVVGHQHRTTCKVVEVAYHLIDIWCIGHHGVGNAMYEGGGGRDWSPGVHQGIEHFTLYPPSVDNTHRSQLHDFIATVRQQAGCLGIKHYVAECLHGCV